LRERERKRLEGLDGEVGVFAFNGFEIDFGVD